MRVLALDLATKTGWAAGSTSAPPTYGTFKLPSTGEDVGTFLFAFDEWLRGMIAVESSEWIIFEAPILSAGRTSVQVARKLMGLSTHVEFVARSLNLTYREASIQTIKKFWTGDGRADKEAMMKMARVYGFTPKDDNASDALALFHYAAHLLDPKHSVTAIGPLGAKAVSCG